MDDTTPHGSDEETESSPVKPIPDTFDLAKARESLPPICRCNKVSGQCYSLQFIMETLNELLSEDSAWSLLHQILVLIRSFAVTEDGLKKFIVPEKLSNIHLHRDGNIHWHWTDEEIYEISQRPSTHMSEDECLQKIGCLIYETLNFTLDDDEERVLSKNLEDIFEFLCFKNINDPKNTMEKFVNFKLPMFHYAIDKCSSRITFTYASNYYKVNCSILVAEAAAIVASKNAAQSSAEESVSSVDSNSSEVEGAADEDAQPSAESEDAPTKQWGEAFNEVIGQLKSLHLKQKSL